MLRAFLDFLVHSAGIILADIVCHLYHFDSYRSGAHSDLNTIANLDLIASLYHPTVYADATVIASLVGNRPTFDQTTDLQILVKTHRKLLADDVLQSLTSLENGLTGSGDLDGLLGAGIAAHASFTGLHFEDTEAGHLNLVALSQAAGDSFESSVDNALCVLLGQTCVLCNCCDEFGFIHSGLPLFIKCTIRISYYSTNFKCFSNIFL